MDEDGSILVRNIGKFKISLFESIILQPTAVIVQLIKLSFNAKEIQNAIEGFIGAESVLKNLFKNNIYLFDDYAHHPAEIAATINAAKERLKIGE